MSTDDLVSQAELSRHVEEYINHRIKDKFYDPSQSGCIFQIHSANPFRLSDDTHHVEISDPTVINNLLKAANKNWNTMRGALIKLTKWRFASSYDEAHDKLKLDIVVDEAEYLPGSGAPYQGHMDNITSLLEAPQLKDKFNRLIKCHVSEDFNTHHPVEGVLDLIDQERQGASEVTRLADTSHLRQPAIGGSLESQNPTFWTYDYLQDKSNQGDIQASQPLPSSTDLRIEDPSGKLPGSLTNVNNQFQASSLENPDLLLGNDRFDPLRGSQPEIQSDDELKAYMEMEDKFGETGLGGEQKLTMELEERQEPVEQATRPQETEPEQAMELEERQELSESVQLKPAMQSKLQDVLNQKKEAIKDSSKPGSKKVTQGVIMDNYGEQQNFMKTREKKIFDAAKDSVDNDILSLLDPGQPQPEKKRPTPVPVSVPITVPTSVPTTVPTPVPVVQNVRPAPVPVVQNIRPAPVPIVQNVRPAPVPVVQNIRPAPVQVQKEVTAPPKAQPARAPAMGMESRDVLLPSKVEKPVAQKEDRTKKRKDFGDFKTVQFAKETPVERKEPVVIKRPQLPAPQPMVQEVQRKPEKKIMGVPSSDFLSEFKLIKNTPLKKEEKDSKLAKFIKKDIELETKKKMMQNLGRVEDDEIIYMPQGKKTKVTPAVNVENPLNKRLTINLNDYKTVHWKISTSSSLLRTKKNKTARFSGYDDEEFM